MCSSDLVLDNQASSSFGLEELVGLVACKASRISDREGEAIFTLPRLPERIAEPAPSSMIAEALGVLVDEIGFDHHQPNIASAGVGFNFVPLKTKDAVTRASIKGARAFLRNISFCFNRKHRNDVPDSRQFRNGHPSHSLCW